MDEVEVFLSRAEDGGGWDLWWGDGNGSGEGGKV